jgi:hypothetical protein
MTGMDPLSGYTPVGRVVMIEQCLFQAVLELLTAWIRGMEISADEQEMKSMLAT